MVWLWICGCAVTVTVLVVVVVVVVMVSAVIVLCVCCVAVVCPLWCAHVNVLLLNTTILWLSSTDHCGSQNSCIFYIFK